LVARRAAKIDVNGSRNPDADLVCPLGVAVRPLVQYVQQAGPARISSAPASGFAARPEMRRVGGGGHRRYCGNRPELRPVSPGRQRRIAIDAGVAVS